MLYPKLGSTNLDQNQRQIIIRSKKQNCIDILDVSHLTYLILHFHLIKV